MSFAEVLVLEETLADTVICRSYRRQVRHPTATAAGGVAWVKGLCAALAVPTLADYGMVAGDIPSLVPKAQAASSMAGNPIRLTDNELTALLTQALEFLENASLICVKRHT